MLRANCAPHQQKQTTAFRKAAGACYSIVQLQLVWMVSIFLIDTHESKAYVSLDGMYRAMLDLQAWTVVS